MLLHSGCREQYVWNAGVPLGNFLALSCPKIKVNENYTTLIQAGLLMTTLVRNEDLGHPRVPTQDHSRHFLKAKGILNGQWKHLVQDTCYDM